MRCRARGADRPFGGAAPGDDPGGGPRPDASLRRAAGSIRAATAASTRARGSSRRRSPSAATAASPASSAIRLPAGDGDGGAGVSGSRRRRSSRHAASSSRSRASGVVRAPPDARGARGGRRRSRSCAPARRVGLVGESGSGKSTHGPAADPPRRARRRARAVRRRGPAGPARRASCAACGAASRSSSRIPTARSTRACASGRIVAEPLDIHGIGATRAERRERAARAARAGRPRPRRARQVPARVLRRPATADRHRARDRLRAAVRRGRRAGVRARPAGPGADRESPGGPPGAPGPGLPLHRPRPARGPSTSADRVAVMYLGRIVEEATASRPLPGAAPPLHEGAPRLDAPDGAGTADARRPSPGEPPSPTHPPPGCRFHPRCPVAEPICSRVDLRSSMLDPAARQRLPPRPRNGECSAAARRETGRYVDGPDTRVSIGLEAGRTRRLRPRKTVRSVGCAQQPLQGSSSSCLIGAVPWRSRRRRSARRSPEMSLAECLRTALKNNLDLVIARKDPAIAEQQIVVVD